MSDRADLVRRAVAWLRSNRTTRNQPHGRQVVVFAELVTEATKEIPDAIGWDARGVSTLVECKTSRADYHRDRLKTSRLAGVQLGRASCRERVLRLV